MTDTKEIIRELNSLLNRFQLSEDKIEFCESLVHPEIKKIFIHDLERRYKRQSRLALDIRNHTKTFEDKRRIILNNPDPTSEKIIISGAIICKNEEETIEQMIVTSYKLCDEICILDTGSTDKTIEILKKYNKVKLFEEKIDPWDFSAARNRSFELCSGEILFVIDGDEYLKTNDVQLRESVIEADNEILSSSVILIGNGIFPMTLTKEPRFFPKGSTVWRNKLHNIPVINDGVPVIGDTGIEIYHLPEISPTKAQARIDRSETFNEELDQEEDFFYKFKMILKTALTARDLKKAFSAARKGLECFKELPADTQKYEADFLLIATRAKFASGSFDVGELLGRYTSLVGTDVDSAFYNFVFFESNESYNDAFNWLKTHFDLAKKFDVLPVAIYETLRFYDNALLKFDLYEFWKSTADPDNFLKQGAKNE